MNFRMKALGTALVAVAALVATSASATVYVIGDLTTQGPLSKSVTDKKGSTVSDQFQFTVDPGVLLTYAQLDNTLNKQSSVLTTGTIELLEYDTSTSSYVSVTPSTLTPIGAQTTSYTLATPTVALGAGAYELDVESKDLSSKLGVNYTVGIFGTAVPEPATWAVMFLGFGAIGASMRSARRRQVALTA